jgi:mRNA interferase HicA
LTFSRRTSRAKVFFGLKHLKGQGCEFLREGSRHSVYGHREAQRSSTVPRDSEIPDKLARKICKDLGVLST